MTMTKNCKKCDQVKPVDCFSKRSQMKDGLEHVCKSCIAAKNQNDKDKNAVRHKRYREANKEKVRQATLNWQINNPESYKRSKNKWRLENPEKFRSLKQKRRAKIRENGTFVISGKEIKRLYESSCFYCGSDNQIEIDHVIPISKGGRHSIGNLVSACKKCNRSKTNKYLVEWRLKASI